jgi:hypothetical protein
LASREEKSYSSPKCVAAAPKERGTERQLSFLPRPDRRALVTFENVSTFLRQEDQRAVVAGGRRGLHEARFLEVPEVDPRDRARRSA